MTCRRNFSQSYDNPIPVCVNTNSFCGTKDCTGYPQPFCYPATEVVQVLQTALETWNRSGADIRFVYIGETINTDPCPFRLRGWLRRGASTSSPTSPRR